MAARPTALILIVDDEPAVAKSIAWLLQREGYTTAVVHTGQEALQAISTLDPDLALVDVVLPDQDGVRTAREICRRRPTCRILLISGNMEAAPLLDAARAQGLNFEVLPKPVAPPELLAKIATLLAGRG